MILRGIAGVLTLFLGRELSFLFCGALAALSTTATLCWRRLKAGCLMWVTLWSYSWLRVDSLRVEVAAWFCLLSCSALGGLKLEP